MITTINSGKYIFRIGNLTQELVEQFSLLYLANASTTEPECWHYSIDVSETSLLRRFVRRQVVISVEGNEPFNPISASHILPSLEWSMNWAIAAFEHTKLIFHASVVVRNNKGIIFPASSGSGKSTLSTYLGANGWQLFSDEMALVDIGDGLLNPLYRPSSLKNRSIDIIREKCPSVTISHIAKGTHKGDIAHARLYTPEQFINFAKARPAFIIFPKYRANKETTIVELNKAQGFAMMITNGFNYNVLGEKAFVTLANVINNVKCYQVFYSDLEDMNDFLCELVND